MKKETKAVKEYGIHFVNADGDVIEEPFRARYPLLTNRVRAGFLELGDITDYVKNIDTLNKIMRFLLVADDVDFSDADSKDCEKVIEDFFSQFAPKKSA